RGPAPDKREQSANIQRSDGCAKLSGATAGIGHHKRNEYRRETRGERTKDGVSQVPGLDPMMHGPLDGDHLAFRGINRRWSIRDFPVAHSGTHTKMQAHPRSP